MVPKFKSFWAKLRNFRNNTVDEAKDMITPLAKPFVNLSSSAARIALKNNYRMRVLDDSFHASKDPVFMSFDVHFYQARSSIYRNDLIQRYERYFQFAE
jgi:hypothetical protein